MGRRRWVVLLAALLVFAAGCGAGGPHRPPPPGAHIVVVLRADGSGRVDFWVGGGIHSDRELRDLGVRVTAALFRGKTLGPTIVKPGTAVVFARTQVPLAYARGPHPTFDVAGDRVGSALKAAGYPGYTLLVRLPSVRSSIGSREHPPGFEYSWKISPDGPPPTGPIVLHPRLLHWAVEMALLAVAIAGVLTAFVNRDTRIALGGCAAGLVAAVTVLVTGGASGDAPGTLGYLSGTPLTLVMWSPIVGLPLGALAIIRLVRLLTRTAARSRIS